MTVVSRVYQVRWGNAVMSEHEFIDAARRKMEELERVWDDDRPVRYSVVLREIHEKEVWCVWDERDKPGKYSVVLREIHEQEV